MAGTKSRTPKHYLVEASYIGESIELKGAQEGLRRYTFLNRDHPLILQYLPDRYIALTKFGVVTFWNVDEEDRRRFLKELAPYIKAQRSQYPYSESIEVTFEENERVTARGVFLASRDVERLKIVSYAMSQSVALERYEDEIEQQLEELETIITNMKTTGRALLRERDLLKQVGRALAVKQTAISHLALFDKPEEVWESPELEKLYGMLSSEFDLHVRFAVLDKKNDFLSENTRMLMGFLAEKRNALLEIVIILLIAIEVIPFVIELLRKAVLQ